MLRRFIRIDVLCLGVVAGTTEYQHVLVQLSLPCDDIQTVLDVLRLGVDTGTTKHEHVLVQLSLVVLQDLDLIFSSRNKGMSMVLPRRSFILCTFCTPFQHTRSTHA